MEPRRIEEAEGPPAAVTCGREGDVGLYHDISADVWYECAFEPRRQVYTWVILPPGE